MPIMEHSLPRLEKLVLYEVHGLRRMFCSVGGFPEVTYLAIHELIESVEWRMERGALPKVRSVEIWNCPIRKPLDALPQRASKGSGHAASFKLAVDIVFSERDLITSEFFRRQQLNGQQSNRGSSTFAQFVLVGIELLDDGNLFSWLTFGDVPLEL
ncbi:hypothetical protein Dimus_027533 [Dionaea muscipula]